MSELAGATEEPPENVMVSNPGEFAALWNSWTEERRQEFLNAMRVASDGYIDCLVRHRRRADLPTGEPMPHDVSQRQDEGEL